MSYSYVKVLSLVLVFKILLISARNACDPVTLSNGIGCKCTATYCDNFDLPPPLSQDSVVVYTSNENGVRLERSILPVQNVQSVSNTIAVQLSGQTNQKIIGFGGAFTDAAAYVISLLPTAAQQKLVSSYYSRQGGASYSLGRVPVGSTDFSRNSYSLFASNGNFALKDDNLVAGVDYKLTLIKKAYAEIAATSTNSDNNQKSLNIFASIWSAPISYKTCDAPPAPSSGVNVCGNGFEAWIRGRPTTPTYLFGGLDDAANIRTLYANYLLNFINAYFAEGISLWGITAQNEPAGNPTGNKWENTNYAPADLVDFVESYLGPIVKAAYPNMKIMVFDDNYPEMAEYAELTDTAAYIDGMGYHWYFSMAGSLIGTGQLLFQFFGGQIEVGNAYQQYTMNNKNGNAFLLMTEACTGYIDNVVQPGSWERGYNYFTSILHELDSGAAGWTDWNIALNMSGGPNWAGNTVDAPILVNTSSGVFYKQPMYYALTHFSAFVPPNAIRLSITGTDLGFIGDSKALEVIAFRKNETSDECILILANDHLIASMPVRGLSGDHTARFILPYGNKQVIIDMPDNTFKTVLFKCPLP